VSFRLFSKEQISAGTTISSRLDKLLSDFLSRWNNVPKRDIRRRWLCDTIVGGYTPSRPSVLNYSNDRHPFCVAYNHNDMVISAGMEPDQLVRNRWRVKGHRVDGILGDANSRATSGWQYVWSTSIGVGDPVRVGSIAVWLITDAVFINTFQYGATPPPGHASGEWSEDFCISLEVDDPFLPEDRRLSSQVFLRAATTIEGWFMQRQAPGAPLSEPTTIPPNTLAEWGTGLPTGLVFVAQDLNIPIPRNSRLRLSLVVPDYAGITASGWRDTANDYDRCPWSRQNIGWNLGLVEGVV